MAGRNRVIGVTRAALLAAAGRLAERSYASLPIPPISPEETDAGQVSIIIPARDEADRLPGLLASLARLDYRDVEIIVVDDGSTDGTAGIVAAAGARVLTAGNLPAGWTGKSHACWVGANAAGGDWLLFTDADTRHAPQSLRAALALAAGRNAGLVSLLARQRCETFWERLLLPYAYFLYFVGARAVNQPGGTPVANGQYLLFRRADYRRIGGHQATRDSLVEDVALARVASNAGIRVVLAKGDDLLEVRMYGSLAEIRAGFGKNATRFLTEHPEAGIFTAGASVLFAGVPLSLARKKRRGEALLAFAAGALSLRAWYTRFGVSPGYALLFPLASAVFELIALESLARALGLGQTVWKGRRY